MNIRLLSLVLLIGTMITLAGCTKPEVPMADDQANVADTMDDTDTMDDAVEADADVDSGDTMDDAVEANSGDTMDDADAGEYIGIQVDTAASTLNWTGRRIANAHYGTVDLANGVLRVDDEGNLVDGAIVIDMTTISSDNDGLTDHLNNEDFFNVEEYPTSTLKITSVTAGEETNSYTVTADLTIKGITNEITFPATWVAQEDGTYVGTARFTIDRTLWDIRYGSAKFFSDLADRAILDEIEYQVEITAS